MDYTNSQMRMLIDEHIHSERDAPHVLQRGGFSPFLIYLLNKSSPRGIMGQKGSCHKMRREM